MGFTFTLTYTLNKTLPPLFSLDASFAHQI